jgi:hypothetical protein
MKAFKAFWYSCFCAKEKLPDELNSNPRYQIGNPLGIHRTSTNFAVLSELGRFPIHFDILKAMLSYWHRLKNLDPDCSSLLKNVPTL